HRSIQGSRPDVAMLASRGEIFLDPVGVALTIDEREQHEKVKRLQRQQFVWRRHTGSVSILPIRYYSALTLNQATQVSAAPRRVGPSAGIAISSVLRFESQGISSGGV